MNRYGRGPAGGPSKATASTTCQKCLKKGHYSYECKAVVQDRPYVARPSRTQQLLNPKLVPKLTSDVPQDLLRKKGVADEQLAKLEEERGRKHERQSEEPDSRGAPKRRRSASSRSSTSVSTISTNRSLSRSPSPRAISRDASGSRNYYASRSHSPPLRSAPKSISPRGSQSPAPRHHLTDSEKKRRRASFSSAESHDSRGRENNGRGSRERATSRSTRRKFKETSPPVRGRRTESRSPQRDRRRGLSNGRRQDDGWQRPSHRNGMRFPSDDAINSRDAPRERSLSPFSKRLALTQAMNR